MSDMGFTFVAGPTPPPMIAHQQPVTPIKGSDEYALLTEKDTAVPTIYDDYVQRSRQYLMTLIATQTKRQMMPGACHTSPSSSPSLSSSPSKEEPPSAPLLAQARVGGNEQMPSTPKMWLGEQTHAPPSTIRPMSDRNRAVSPESVMQIPHVLMRTAPAKRATSSPADDLDRRVTIWHSKEKRKLSGNSAPFKRNLHAYLRKHPDWEEYTDQDVDAHGKKVASKKRKIAPSQQSATPEPPMPQIDEPIGDLGAPDRRPIECAAEKRSQELATKRMLIQVEGAAHREAQQRLREAEDARRSEALALIARSKQERVDQWKEAMAAAQKSRDELDSIEQQKRKNQQLQDEHQQRVMITQAMCRVTTQKRARLAA